MAASNLPALSGGHRQDTAPDIFCLSKNTVPFSATVTLP